MSQYSVVELAKIEAALAGIIAGFALTIVVLLVQHHAEQKSGYDTDLGSSAIKVFVTTFVISMLASFLYALAAGDLSGDSPRAYLLLLLAAYPFGISAMSLILGLTLFVRAYSSLARQTSYLIIVLHTLALFAAIQYTYTVENLIRLSMVPSDVSLGRSFATLTNYAGLIIAATALFAYRYWRSRQVSDKSHRVFSSALGISCIIISSVLGGYAAYVTDLDPAVRFHPLSVALLNVVFCLSLAALLAHAPKARTPVNQSRAAATPAKTPAV